MLDVSATTSMSPGSQYLSQTIASYFLLVTVVILVTRVWLSESSRPKPIKMKSSSSRDDTRPLPGPYGIPVLGNMLSLGRSDPHLSLMNLAKKFGSIFQIRLGSRPVLVLNGYEAIHKALIKQAVIFAGRPKLFTFELINNGGNSETSLTFANYGETWKVHRKLAESSLRHFTAGSQVKFVESVVSSEASELVQHIKSMACDENNNNNNTTSTQCKSLPENVGNIRNVLRLAVSNVMCWFMFSKRHTYEDEALLKLISISDRFTAAAGSGNPVDFMPWLRIFFQKATSDFKAMLKEFRTFVTGNLLDAHTAEYKDGSERDIIDHLVTSGRRFNQDENKKTSIDEGVLLDTCFDYFGAGFETVSTTFEWCLLYMAAYPDIQCKLQQEIDEVVGQDRMPSLQDRDKLPLVQSCILEILRHSTPVTFAIPHSTTSDTVLDGFFVPKDTVVFTNLYSAHFDPEVWDEPEKFDASRFLTSEGSIDLEMKKHVIPFSVGRRRCIGSDLARIELFLFFSIFLQNFSIEHSQDGPVSMEGIDGLARRPKHFNVNLISRK
nr:cytochrome P450 1A1-like [Lytechinus pictus]